jgi:hypothetical protein
MLDTLPTDTTPGLGRRAVLGGATALTSNIEDRHIGFRGGSQSGARR